MLSAAHVPGMTRPPPKPMHTCTVVLRTYAPSVQRLVSSGSSQESRSEAAGGVVSSKKIKPANAMPKSSAPRHMKMFMGVLLAPCSGAFTVRCERGGGVRASLSQANHPPGFPGRFTTGSRIGRRVPGAGLWPPCARAGGARHVIGSAPGRVVLATALPLQGIDIAACCIRPRPEGGLCPSRSAPEGSAGSPDIRTLSGNCCRLVIRLRLLPGTCYLPCACARGGRGLAESSSKILPGVRRSCPSPHDA